MLLQQLFGLVSNFEVYGKCGKWCLSSSNHLNTQFDLKIVLKIKKIYGFWVSGNMLMRNVFDLNRRLEFIYRAITLQSIYSINPMSCCKPFFQREIKMSSIWKKDLEMGFFRTFFVTSHFCVKTNPLEIFFDQG